MAARQAVGPSVARYRHSVNNPLSDEVLMGLAIDEARAAAGHDDVPVGAVVAVNGEVVARRHNERELTGDPTAHAEVVCIRNAGRRRNWPELTLVSTLSPCIMCTGTSLLYRIPRVIVGENRNFMGAEDLFRARGVALEVVQDPRCIALMARFVREQPDLWNEDIGI